MRGITSTLSMLGWVETAVETTDTIPHAHFKCKRDLTFFCPWMQDRNPDGAATCPSRSYQEVRRMRPGGNTKQLQTISVAAAVIAK